MAANANALISADVHLKELADRKQAEKESCVCHGISLSGVCLCVDGRRGGMERARPFHVLCVHVTSALPELNYRIDTRRKLHHVVQMSSLNERCGWWW